MKPLVAKVDEGRTVWMLVAGFFLAAVILRTWHLNWGLPDIEEEAFPMKKAFEMCGWGTGHIQFDPATAGWPSLSFYLHMALQGVQYGVGRLTGEFGNPRDFFLQTLDMSQMAIWARGLGVFAAAVVTAAGVRAGLRLAGLVGGVMSGLTLLVSPMLARHAQLITPDILLTMFAALALDRIIAVYQKGRLRDEIWAAVWIGLGASVKYTPAFLVPVLVLAHLQHRRTEGKALLPGLWDRKLVLAGTPAWRFLPRRAPTFCWTRGFFPGTWACRWPTCRAGISAMKASGPGWCFMCWMSWDRAWVGPRFCWVWWDWWSQPGGVGAGGWCLRRRF